jgi:hypothetical protein
MDWPVDASKLTFLFGKAEPVLDFKTKAPVPDRDGVPLYRVVLAVMTPEGDVERVTVKVPGEPRGIAAQTPVRADGLTVSFWTMKDKDTGGVRSGEALRAERIVPLTGAGSKAA